MYFVFVSAPHQINPRPNIELQVAIKFYLYLQNKANLLVNWRHFLPNVQLAERAVDVIYIVAHVVLG